MANGEGYTNGTPRLTWANIVGTIIVAGLIFSGMWTIIQTEFNANDREKEIYRRGLERETKLLEESISEIKKELVKRRDMFITEQEFERESKEVHTYLDHLRETTVRHENMLDTLAKGK